MEELEQIIASENLDHDATYAFVRNAFQDGSLATTGTAITKIMVNRPSRFAHDGGYGKKRESVLSKLASFFERFFDISGGEFTGKITTTDNEKIGVRSLILSREQAVSPTI